jgi:excinuclease ABC subunit A
VNPRTIPPPTSIRLRGVRQHNLKNLDLDIPLDRLTVVSGVSGSGKSSLVLDTLYAEGQRRYVESFSSYARQFLERMDRPEVDLVDGIPPAVAIEQRNTVRTSRSTVGTMTEIQDYLKLLWARAGTVHCAGCGKPVTVDPPASVARTLEALPKGTAVLLTFPLPMGGDLPWKERVGGLKALGLPRLLVRATVAESGDVRHLPLVDAEKVAEPKPGDPPPEVVVDRLTAGTSKRGRVIDSVETAYRLGRGRAALHPEGGPPIRFSRALHCAACDLPSRAPTPNLFSFNSPIGACPECKGFGRVIGLDLDLVVPDPSRSLAAGAIKPWTTPSTEEERDDLKEACRARGIPMDVPWRSLPAAARRTVVDGEGKGWYGVRGWFRWLETKVYKLHVRVLLSRYRSYERCPSCAGARLRPEALLVKVGERSLPEAAALPAGAAREFFEGLRLPREKEEVCGVLLREVRARLGYLCDVGLDYLTLDRAARTLSGGEFQRVNLTTALGSSLVNTLFVLDEPSVGLHPRDTDRMLRILESLRDRGNTVVVVEHDLDVIRRADRLVDLGPGPGEAGGEIVYQGVIQGAAAEPRSLTGAHLSGRAALPVPASRRPPRGALRVRRAVLHNLRGLDLDLPLGLLAGVCGVSGSGKSTLVEGILVPGLLRRLGRPVEGEAGASAALEGGEGLADCVLVDQSPIGRTPRSNPATYVGAWSAIRKAFAATPGARSRRFTASTFSFNSPGGRCERCEGAGHETLEMQFLADVFVPCPECRGARFRPEVLRVRLRGRTVDEVLRMTVEEAAGFFADEPGVAEKLAPLVEVGLGYLRLGQPGTTLSGGEAQRLKLASHLGDGGGKGSTLFLLDEPTTGLHAEDVKTLLGALGRLVDAGHSVVVVEHNLDVLAACDRLLELGPEGGDGGGRLVASGTPEDVAAAGTTTGIHLRRRLGIPP